MVPADPLVQQINVEIEGLRSVAADMRKELEQGFRTQVTPVHDAMQPGARIGGCIPGPEWVQLQERYSTCIERTLDTLYNLDLGTQAVSQAAQTIAQNYGDSDAFSKATVDDVNEIISWTPPPAPVYGPFAPQRAV
ncbi:hypothetical protein [Spirilliplanes yamanashiensis]|uniref:Uncharacterized protein n=1 Tax=Spirilliplanes yamanashiensis TaxID=42233 RepID=A0A8J4DL80_9ACTN|nr:hypothetical protein [Spirilliplanes yamanashiensis]MDP9816201.1 hypothetical protein [Spirilliplanes yamanashiensis]GIJ05726.1 hypothetical protein Sya03_50780 [Spirilliplanes yamanashiensis]